MFEPRRLVPTSYPDLTESDIEKLGKVKLVVYANQGLRAAVTGMEKVFAQIRAERGIHNVDKTTVPVEHIFELQNVGIRSGRRNTCGECFPPSPPQPSPGTSVSCAACPEPVEGSQHSSQ
jgi:hypothetical protein